MSNKRRNPHLFNPVKCSLPTFKKLQMNVEKKQTMSQASIMAGLVISGLKPLNPLGSNLKKTHLFKSTEITTKAS